MAFSAIYGIQGLLYLERKGAGLTFGNMGIEMRVIEDAYDFGFLHFVG